MPTEKKEFKKGPNLYELSEELQAMVEDMELWAEENNGDVTDYPFERLEKLEGEVKDKVLKCAVMFKEWKAQGVAIRSEEVNLAKRRQAHENRGARLKAWMESCLPPNAKFEDARAAVSWKKNPAAVEVLVPVSVLPELFIRRADPEADKAEFKARMMEYQVPETDSFGAPTFDTEGKPLLKTEMQVRWPLPTGEKKMVLNEEKGLDEEVDVLEERPIARMVQGKSLMIK